MGGAGGRDHKVWRQLAAAVAVGLVGLAAVQPAAAQNLEEYDYANLGVRAIGAEVLYVDASQNEGTHVHTVWRDFNGDFGRDLLGQHYQATTGTTHRH